VPIELPWEGCISINGPQAAAERLWYAEHEIALLAWSSLAGGFFSGRISRDNLHPRNHQEQLCIETYGVEENFERLDRASELSREKGATLPQIALAFVLAGPLDTFAITGASSGARFGENVGALTVDLSERELDWLDLRVDER
jgi:aryl-alcohol dehydrogenase-like predicted oxidoreductase